MMAKIKLLGILDIKSGKDLALFILPAVFWMLAVEKVSIFFNIINTPGKFFIYVVGVFGTWLVLRKIIKT